MATLAPPGGRSTPAAIDESAAGMLRLVISGSVDDGKSTLIGRLLYDSKQILSDQLHALRLASDRRNGDGALDLSLLTDGLRAEREQGITIDVAYRYFQTPRRKFIVADTPGHERYTRNMVTGASDRRPRRDPDRRPKRRRRADAKACLHRFAARYQALGRLRQQDGPCRLPGVLLREIERDFREFCARLEVTDVTFIPISALHGENVVERSALHALVPGPGAALSPRARPHRL